MPFSTPHGFLLACPCTHCCCLHCYHTPLPSCAFPMLCGRQGGQGAWLEQHLVGWSVGLRARALSLGTTFLLLSESQDSMFNFKDTNIRTNSKLLLDRSLLTRFCGGEYLAFKEQYLLGVHKWSTWNYHSFLKMLMGWTLKTETAVIITTMSD